MIMNQRRLTYREYLLLLALTGLTLFVYSGAIHFEFTNWDDDIHVTNNPSVKILSVKSVADLFIPSDKYMYHPLTMLTFMVEWYCAGDNPLVFHATNIALHLINIWFVFFIVFRLSRNNVFSLLIASIFALHPLQCESVAWISARKDLLSGMFVLSSALLYLRWKEDNSLSSYLASVIFFVLSLLSKPSSVILPLLFITYDMMQEKKLSWNIFKSTVLFVLLSIMFTLFIVLTTTSHSELPLYYYSVTQRIVLIFYEISFYIFKFIIPINLSACYSYPQQLDGTLPVQYVLGAMTTFILLILVVIYRKRIQTATVGLVLYCIFILPVLQIIPFNNASLTADRYVYLGIAGLTFCGVAVVDLMRIRFKISSWVIAAASITLVGVFCFMSLQRITVWKDSITLFTDVIRKDPNTAIAYGNRANARVARGDYEGAIKDCNTLLLLFPNEPKAYFNRGNAYSELKKPREAIADYSMAVGLGFTSPNVFYNRGNQFFILKEYDSAAADYGTVVRLSPAYLAALIQLDSIATSVTKDFRSSVKYLTEYVSYVPNDASIYYKRARSYASLGRYGDALNDAAVAVSLNKNRDTTDQFIMSLNDAVDSINTALISISSALPLRDTPLRKKLLEERSALYMSLGDTLRAKNDMAKSVLIH